MSASQFAERDRVVAAALGLLGRVRRRHDRPLLKTDDPGTTLRTLIDLRYPVYALADVTVESRDVQHGQMVNDVVRALAQWSASPGGDHDTS